MGHSLGGFCYHYDVCSYHLHVMNSVMMIFAVLIYSTMTVNTPAVLDHDVSQRLHHLATQHTDHNTPQG